MGDNQEMACSTSSPKPRTRSGRIRKTSRSKLPTPPPDPTASSPLSDPDEEFISSNALEYINSLQKTMFTSVIATEDAFDHLDKLYKLMEQMLDLRQQNARLLNRIRDLEHLKNLESMHHQLSISGNIQDIDDDSVYAESLLGSMLTQTKKDFKSKPWTRSLLTQSITKRQRSASALQNNENELAQSYRKFSGGSGLQKPSKVSKWTKVKAAFRWEKASSSVTGAKSQDSGISGMTPINFEIARYLRVPSSDDAGNSPADSGAADGSTPGSLSSASSNDDIHRQGTYRDSQCSDDDHNSTCRKERQNKSNVSIKRSQHYHDGNRSEDDKMDASDKENYTSVQRSSVKSNKYRQRRGTKTQIPDHVVARYQKAVADDDPGKNSNRKRISKWVRVKKAFLNPAMEPVPVDEGVLLYKSCDERDKIQEEIEDNYKLLQKKLSIEFKGKLQEWEKLKSSGSCSSSSTYTRSDCASEEPRDPAFAKKMEEWEKLKTTHPAKQPPQCAQIVREEDLPPDFKKKLDEWQKIKKCSTKDDLLSSSKPKKKLGEWPKWKSISGHREEQHGSGADDLQPLSGDFLKKLEEWRRIKDTTQKYHDINEKTPSPNTDRKHSQTSPILKLGDCQNLQWFELELNKIEHERKRLEAERQKFLQREERLGILRRTVLGNENKKDVLIHTPSGFYRFEGISRKFTQKLCEWETSRGIGPEASTFALLTSNITPHITVNMCEKESPVAKPRLHRSKSAESLTISHLNDSFQSRSHHPSSLSLNDIDELERQCLALSTSSSYQNICQSMDNLDIDEPEAVIVEVEDVEEETAAPLEEYLEEKHFPIYQRESLSNKYEKQLVVIPHVQEATSTINPQYPSGLLDEIIRMAKTLLKDRDVQNKLGSQDALDRQCTNGYVEQTSHATNFRKEQIKNNQQIILHELIVKTKYLQEICLRTQSVITQNQVQNPIDAPATDAIRSSQDIFTQIFQMIEELQNNQECSDAQFVTMNNAIYGKLIELRQIVTHLYTNSDMSDHKEIEPETFSSNDCNNVEIVVDPAVVERFVISTSTNYLNADEFPHTQHEPSSIFVNTTRRLFTPFEKDIEKPPLNNNNYSRTTPESPTAHRKLPKEISPTIRVMLAKYNQMITQQDQPKPTSGSSSPIPWRSPVAERRVKERRERYIEEIEKIKGGHDVMKSASSAILNRNDNKTTSNKGILRSTSASVIQNNVQLLSIEICDLKQLASAERYTKLQRAKEEFMRSSEIEELPPEPCSAPPTCSKEQIFTTRSRLSQVSMESESSYNSSACALVKSASVGMINLDERDYAAIHQQYGYMSLPRVVTKQNKSGIFEGLSNIAAKFRKVKMKRGKKMNTVSELCRQSLVVDLNPGSQEHGCVDGRLRNDSLMVPTPSSSEDTSPSSSRSGSWIRRSRIFKI